MGPSGVVLPGMEADAEECTAAPTRLCHWGHAVGLCCPWLWAAASLAALYMLSTAMIGPDHDWTHDANALHQDSPNANNRQPIRHHSRAEKPGKAKAAAFPVLMLTLLMMRPHLDRMCRG